MLRKWWTLWEYRKTWPKKYWTTT